MKLALLLLVVTACREREEAAKREPERTAVVTPPAEPKTIPSCTPGERTCAGDDVVACEPDGTLGRTVETCKGACKAGACAETCALRDVELVYVVDNANNLYSFDPKKLPGDPFHRIGTLACDRTSTPNSMAVDRTGIAWLGYQNGKLYRASITDAQCSASGEAPKGGATTRFGMGFASDGPKAETETLYVTGSDGKHELASLDITKRPALWQRVAEISEPGDHPELTGTGDGKLFAYFPSPGRGFVTELDRKTAAARGPKWKLEGTANRIEAYAFAFWGGKFWVFTTADGNSMIHSIHIETRKQTVVRENLPFAIVGAGVSTCAPLLEQAP